MATIYGKIKYYSPSGRGDYIDADDGVTNGADLIFGTSPKDTIYGLNGDDVLKGGGWADKLFGGEGIDTAAYGDSNEGVQVSLAIGEGTGGTASNGHSSTISRTSVVRPTTTRCSATRTPTRFVAKVAMTCSKAAAVPTVVRRRRRRHAQQRRLGDMIDGGTGIDDTANFSEASQTGSTSTWAWAASIPASTTSRWCPAPPTTSSTWKTCTARNPHGPHLRRWRR